MKTQIGWPVRLIITLSVAVVTFGLWVVGVVYMCRGENPVAENLFGAATALVAMTAIVVAVFQIRASDESQKLATAADIYKGYLTLVIEHPDVSRNDGKGGGRRQS
ncbi:MAG: hypothetical protein WCB27_03470 [Thermoguttaceae bacterium]